VVRPRTSMPMDSLHGNSVCGRVYTYVSTRKLRRLSKLQEAIKTNYKSEWTGWTFTRSRVKVVNPLMRHVHTEIMAKSFLPSSNVTKSSIKGYCVTRFICIKKTKREQLYQKKKENNLKVAILKKNKNKNKRYEKFEKLLQ